MVIKKDKNKNIYVLYSHKNKKLGEFKTKREAIFREKQINYFKNKNIPKNTYKK